MPRSSLLAALPVIAAGWPAAADITGAELWDLWRGGAGATVTAASETQDGAVLRLEGVTARFGVQGSSATALIDWVELEDQDGGTVRVTSATDYELRLEDPAAGDRPATVITGRLRHEGAVTTVARQGETFTTDTEAPGIVVLFEDIASGETGGSTDVTLTLTELASQTRFDPDAPGGGGAEMRAAALAFDLAGEEEGQTFQVTGRYDMVKSRSSGPLFDYLGADGALPGGEADAPLTGVMGHGGSHTRIELSSAEGDMAVESASAEGMISVAAEDGTATYEGTTRGVTLGVAGDTIPLTDAAVAIERLDVAMSLPALPSEEPQTFEGNYEITGLTASDQIWSLFDPGGVLPRDPAELSLRVSGTGRMTADPAVIAADGMGVDVSTIRLDRLFVAALGAELTGVGALDLASGATPFEPEGRLEFGLVGANLLIDRLAGAGILPPGQLTGVRMALGMFTAPAEGEDALKTTVVFGPGGTVEVNGTRMR